jgi:hypothetical protein
VNPATGIAIIFSLIASVQSSSRYITSDKLNNFYTITDYNDLTKYDSTGKKLYTYDAYEYGKLQSVDASNPLQILCLYPDYFTVTMLDNTLTVINSFNLNVAGISQVSAVCSSNDGYMWVWDAQQQVLKKLDNLLNVQRQSQDAITLLGQPIYPNFMVERNNFVFMNVPSMGILVFDIFGTYGHTIPIKNLTDFQVINDKIYYFRNDSLSTYQFKTDVIQSIALPDTGTIQQVSIQQGRLFALKKNQVLLYTISVKNDR